MKTVLIYVISTILPPWDSMIRWSQETWDSESPEGTSTYYYTDRFNRPLPDRTYAFEIDPGYNNMGKKDILAYRWALNHWKFDYMARVNSSCYVGKRRLLEHVQTLPDKNVFQGVGFNYEGKTALWGGGQYIMSRDVVQAFVDHAKSWDHSIMEDVAMSKLAPSLGIPLDTTGNACSINKRDKDWLCIYYNQGKQGAFEFVDFADVKKANQYFFRCKQDGNRPLDFWIMKQLKQLGI